MLFLSLVSSTFWRFTAPDSIETKDIWWDRSNTSFSVLANPQLHKTWHSGGTGLCLSQAVEKQPSHSPSMQVFIILYPEKTTPNGSSDILFPMESGLYSFHASLVFLNKTFSVAEPQLNSSELSFMGTDTLHSFPDLPCSSLRLGAAGIT